MIIIGKNKNIISKSKNKNKFSIPIILIDRPRLYLIYNSVKESDTLSKLSLALNITKIHISDMQLYKNNPTYHKSPSPIN